MSIDPKKCGACYYCKHCEDIGVQPTIDGPKYLRKCKKEELENVDVCVQTCYYFEVKDSAPAVTPKKKNYIPLIIIVCCVVLAIVAVLAVSSIIKGLNEKADEDSDKGAINAVINEELPDGKLNNNTVKVPENSLPSETVDKTKVVYPVKYPSYKEMAHIVTTAKDPLNIRNIPGDYIDSEVIDTISRFSLVEVLSYEGEWYRIRCGSVEGYASSQFLTPLLSTKKGVLYNGTEAIPLLKNAKTDSKVLKKVEGGSEVHIIAKTKSGEYTRVYYDSNTYWVRTEYVN